MYEVKESQREKVILVTVSLHADKLKGWDAEASGLELRELALSSGVNVIDEVLCRRDEFTPNYLIGKGKAEEIHDLIHAHDEDVGAVLFSKNLSSTQQNNLEDILGVKTIDRTQLILDVFAMRAHSNEGKLQVELAQLEYLIPRLSGKGIMLSRLGGGIGTRGPGEQKLEVDRRRIRKRVLKVKKELEGVSLRRSRLRRNRAEHSVATIALIGYTNAGKSTLLNTLTESNVSVSKKLFNTLDPTSRRYSLPNNQKVLFVDTVGFIHNLPHNLIEAFKATLEELQEAELLLHVLDVSDPKASEHLDAVYEVLKELKAESKPVVTVLNKIDLVDNDHLITRFRNNVTESIALSALNGEGLDRLVDAVTEKLSSLIETVELFMPHSSMSLVSSIYKEGNVIEREDTPEGIRLKAAVPARLKFKIQPFLTS
ncbi:MAG: GTPase HflX [Candidatus Omnitrophica bacterium]|nr:GTPase HflX [Candidatus Omnitrophota bacterium]